MRAFELRQCKLKEGALITYTCQIRDQQCFTVSGATPDTVKYCWSRILYSGALSGCPRWQTNRPIAQHDKHLAWSESRYVTPGPPGRGPQLPTLSQGRGNDMPNDQLTENCQFVKETVIFWQLGARVQNLGPQGPSTIHRNVLLWARVICVSIILLDICHTQNEPPGHGHSKID